MVTDTPSAREKRLAGELRRLREGAQLNGKQVAARLGWSASKVSRIETSHIGVASADLERMLDLYAVPAERADHLRQLAPSARPKGWWDAYADTLTSGYANLIRLEAGSRAVQCYSAVIPHPLLQTPDYTRHVIETTALTPSPSEVERRMVICRRRQDLLAPRPSGASLELSAVIDEAVLHRQVVGGDGEPDPELLRAQLRHLLAMAALANVTLQVLPYSAGIPPVTAGSFSLLTPAGAEAPDVVYMDNKTRIFYIESESEVHAYAQEMTYLRGLALTPTRSRSFLRSLLRSS